VRHVMRTRLSTIPALSVGTDSWSMPELMLRQDSNTAVRCVKEHGRLYCTPGQAHHSAGSMKGRRSRALFSLGELGHGGADAAEAHAGAALRDGRVQGRPGHGAQASGLRGDVAAQEHAGRVPVVTLRPSVCCVAPISKASRGELPSDSLGTVSPELVCRRTRPRACSCTVLEGAETISEGRRGPGCSCTLRSQVIRDGN